MQSILWDNVKAGIYATEFIKKEGIELLEKIIIIDFPKLGIITTKINDYYSSSDSSSDDYDISDSSSDDEEKQKEISISKLRNYQITIIFTLFLTIHSCF